MPSLTGNALNGKKVLIVGGAGFIGSHIVDELTKTDIGEVVIYDNFCRGTKENLSASLADPRVNIFDIGGDVQRTDILNEAVKGSDYVIHLAALWLLQCHDFPRAAFDVNIQGTFNVLEACQRQGVKKLVYSSSASVYGDAVELPMTEDHPFNNRTFYGATKIAGEAMCRAYYDRYGLDYVGLRYMNVYGARQDYKGAYIAVIMKMLDRIDKGLPPLIYGDGSQSYDFIYVQDVARANLKALVSDATDGFYNVGSGVQTSIKEVAERLLVLTDCGLDLEYLPAGQTFVTNRVGCTKNAIKDLDFKTTIDLDEGLLKLIEWRNADIERTRKIAQEAEAKAAKAAELAKLKVAA